MDANGDGGKTAAGKRKAEILNHEINETHENWERGPRAGTLKLERARRERLKPGLRTGRGINVKGPRANFNVQRSRPTWAAQLTTFAARRGLCALAAGGWEGSQRNGWFDAAHFEAGNIFVRRAHGLFQREENHTVLQFFR